MIKQRTNLIHSSSKLFVFYEEKKIQTRRGIEPPTTEPPTEVDYVTLAIITVDMFELRVLLKLDCF